MKKIKLDFDTIHIVEGDKIYPLPDLEDHFIKYLIGELLSNLSDDNDLLDHAVNTIKKHGKISLTFAKETIIEGETK